MKTINDQIKEFFTKPEKPKAYYVHPDVLEDLKKINPEPKCQGVPIKAEEVK